MVTKKCPDCGNAVKFPFWEYLSGMAVKVCVGCGQKLKVKSGPLSKPAFLYILVPYLVIEYFGFLKGFGIYFGVLTILMTIDGFLLSKLVHEDYVDEDDMDESGVESIEQPELTPRDRFMKKPNND